MTMVQRKQFERILCFMSSIVNESTSFCSTLEKHLKPSPWKHQLRQFCEEQLDCPRLFIRKYRKGPRSPFKELDIKAPIEQQLVNVFILEFPVIYVFFPSHSINFIVIKNVNPTIHKPPQKDFEGNQSLEGVSFKEKIEDGYRSAEPQVFDLVKHFGSSWSHQMLSQNKSSEQALNDSSDKPLFEGDTVENVSPSLKTKQLEISEDFAFGFDQDLIDFYDDLIAKINPDDFLDFESEFAKKTEVDEIDLCDSIVDTVPEELEEGEIVE